MRCAAYPWTDAQREDRRLGSVKADQRTPFQQDRDRILYSSAFRRLGGVTQIVRADEADVFHTRQQHTYKVAQVGRRLAEKCIQQQTDICVQLGVDAEVVEAACLAHDLGHPPFGHVGEKALNEKVEKAGDADGFEGNAQTFRILTRLSVRHHSDLGLDLSRATLAAVLKYPWLRDDAIDGRGKKWSAYKDDQEDFRFARELFPHENKTAEAELMDWSDDVAYSVHDLEDFHRCAAVPWGKIFSKAGKEQLVQSAEKNWWKKPRNATARLRGACDAIETLLRGAFSLEEPYEGTREQRQQLRTLTSQLIGLFINAASLKVPSTLGEPCIEIAEKQADQVKVLKQITRDYIINTPSLAAQQKGQKRIVADLFDALHDDSRDSYPAYLPPRLRYFWTSPQAKARFAADCIASLSEREAVALHARLSGTSSGSVLDPILR